MRPPAVAVDFGTLSHSSDSDYDHISYPSTIPEEQLPLYNSSMAEETARRRFRAPVLHHDDFANNKEHVYYDDEGKDVYNKVNRNVKPYLSSGRLPQPPPPPPTSIVAFLCFFLPLNADFYHSANF